MQGGNGQAGLILAGSLSQGVSNILNGGKLKADVWRMGTTYISTV